MQIEVATIEDAAAILALQREAYQEVADRYDDPTLPPLTETLEDMEDQLAIQTVLKLCLAGQIVGSVRAYLQGGTCHIGRLIVAQAFRGQGIGSALMLNIEGYFPEAQCFELFTGHKCLDTQRLYERLGYEVEDEEPVSAKVTHVIMRKAGCPGGDG